MLRNLACQIRFPHLRATRREADRLSFHEAPHLDSGADMAAVVRAALAAERCQGLQLPFRPDHGHAQAGDQRRNSPPGYPLIGRLRGLADFRGVARALPA